MSSASAASVAGDELGTIAQGHNSGCNRGVPGGTTGCSRGGEPRGTIQAVAWAQNAIAVQVCTF